MREKEIIQNENHWEISDFIKWNNIHIIESLEKEKKEAENLFEEIIAENIYNVVKEAYPNAGGIGFPQGGPQQDTY